MVANLYYFDRAHETACREFCLERKITTLPVAEDDFQYVEMLDDHSFVRRALIDPEQIQEIVKETLYRFNGVLIRRLRGLTSELATEDTYGVVTEAVLAQGKKFFPELKSFLQKKPHIHSRIVNEIGGIYLRNHLDDMLHLLRKLLPVQVSDEDWVVMGDNVRKGFQTILIQQTAPPLTYKVRHDWVDRLRIVSPDERLFQEDVYERFRYSDVLFVMEGGARVGVVHFSDYNQMPVVTQTFSKLHHLERELVKALAQRAITLEDVDRMQEEYPIATAEWDMLQNKFGDRTDQPIRYHDLSRLYLKTLLRLYNLPLDNESHPPTPLEDTNLINLLRNRVAHSSDLIDRVDTSRASLIFDFNSFAHFFRQQRALEIALRQVRSHNFYMETTY